MLRTTVMPALMLVVGLAVIVRTAAAGREIGILLGVLLVAAGGLRLYAEHRRGGA
jgi:hypothetical protein